MGDQLPYSVLNTFILFLFLLFLFRFIEHPISMTNVMVYAILKVHPMQQRSDLTTFQSTSLSAIAEVYETEGNEAYLKEDYSNAIYFYTEGIKVNCKDQDLKAKLYSNRAYANLRLGETICTLICKRVMWQRGGGWEGGEAEW